jgi:hypothetical protein
MDRRFNIAVGKLLKNKMDEKFYVSLEVARLLKEKGYNEKCITYYQDNCREIYYSFCGERNSNWEERCVSAPSKAEVIDWLDRKIHIGIGYDDLHSKWHYDITPVIPGTKIINNLSFSTRLEAEEAAIIDALENL